MTSTMDTTPEQAVALRSAAIARAWHAGRKLAALLTEHQVPRPEHVRTTVWRGRIIAGHVTVYAAMAAAADLLRLVRLTGAKLQHCQASSDREQMYARLAGPPAQIEAHWAGALSGSGS